MFHLVIKIERDVTIEEIEEFSKFAGLLRKGDVFSLTPLMPVEKIESKKEPVVKEEEKPIPPSAPVIVQEPHKRRRWQEILGSAFAKILNVRPKNSDERQLLRDTFAWFDCDRAEWVSYRKDSLSDVLGIKDKDLGYTLVYLLLRFLGRQPVSTSKEVILPPTLEAWTNKKEMERREQEEANLKLTGDPHIGFPLHEVNNCAVTPQDILYEKLQELDWSSSERRLMTIKEFLTSCNLPFSRGNAIRLGLIAQYDFGGLKKTRQTKEGILYAFPPRKN